MLMLLSVHVTSVLFLVQFNTFVLTGLLLELHALTLVARFYALLPRTQLLAIFLQGRSLGTRLGLQSSRAARQ